MVCPKMAGEGGGGGSANPGELDFVKAHVGWDFEIHNDPQGGKVDSTAFLKNWEDLGKSDEWCAILEHIQNSFDRVFPIQGRVSWVPV